MNCKSFEALIALNAEGDLDPSRAKNVESHLKSCASCQRFVAELKASQALVKDLAEESLDPASFDVVRQRVMLEVNRRQASRPIWWHLLLPPLAEWRPALAAALVALVALGFLLQWHLWQKPEQADKVDSSIAVSVPAVPKESPDSSPLSPPENTEPQKPTGEPAARQFAKRAKIPAPHALLSAVEGQPEEVVPEDEPPVEQGSNLEPEEPPPADIAPEPPPPLVIKLITDDPNIVIVWLVDQEVQHN